MWSRPSTRSRSSPQHPHARHIDSIPATATHFTQAARGHGGVENRLHWRLDLVFGENASRLLPGQAPAIMTTLRHPCMNPFECEGSTLSLPKKHRKAAWNDDFRATVGCDD